MTPLFIIPARGGSKSIPGKNIKPLCGKPLIAYSIESALALAPQSRVIVTTDSDDIAACARKYGVDNPYMRPESLASDTAGSREVMLDATKPQDVVLISTAWCCFSPRHRCAPWPTYRLLLTRMLRRSTWP